MDISLLVIGAITLLKPLLEKAGDKAAETIGEKLADKITEKGIWTKIKEFFIKYEEVQVIEQIENKTIATQEEITLIEEVLKKGCQANPLIAEEIQNHLNLDIAKHLLLSIQKDREDLENFYEDRRLASVDAVGGYEVMIGKTRRRLEKDEKEFLELVKKKNKI